MKEGTLVEIMNPTGVIQGIFLDGVIMNVKTGRPTFRMGCVVSEVANVREMSDSEWSELEEAMKIGWTDQSRAGAAAVRGGGAKPSGGAGGGAGGAGGGGGAGGPGSAGSGVKDYKEAGGALESAMKKGGGSAADTGVTFFSPKRFQFVLHGFKDKSSSSPVRVDGQAKLVGKKWKISTMMAGRKKMGTSAHTNLDSAVQSSLSASVSAPRSKR